jgi:hypothetical protein
VIIPFTRRLILSAVAMAAAVGGAFVAWHYHRAGLTLSHYDARGHLVVARRIADNLTPGWQQIGAVWLPLPHLLNALPVQLDSFYRTGASAVAISIVSFAVTTCAIAWIVWSLTDSPAAAVAGAAVFALNPNVLYLQATPMTEPLLLALTTLAVAMLMHRVDGRRDGARATRGAAALGWVLALACLTRYEAWPVTACALAGAAWARWRQGRSPSAIVGEIGGLALYPLAAVVCFSMFSRVVVGQWFVSDGFFTPENKALGLPFMAISEIAWGTRALSGPLLLGAGLIGFVALTVLGLVSRPQAHAAVALSLVTTMAVPWAAFVKGHPFRIRYMVPLMAIEAVGAGVAAGLLSRVRRGGTLAVVAVLALVACVAVELHPLDATAPMIVEAQWDRPNAPVRAQMTACLGRPASGEKIMASMGSLGHYMQDASRSGFAIRDFLHEGNGDIWLAALDGARPFAEWILIEEKAEGGDMLAHIARERPSFLDGYRRICGGAGLVLYRREPNLIVSVDR